MWVSQRDTLQNSCTRPRTNRTLFVCEALVERMRASHSAAGFRVSPSSCSVSEVLKTSQSTFFSETDTRNNSWARTEEFRVLLLGKKKKVISFSKTKDVPADADSMCQTPVNQSQIKDKRNSLVSLFKRILNSFRNPKSTGFWSSKFSAKWPSG